MKAGTYKLSFDTEGYWKKRGQESFYPYVEVRARGVEACDSPRFLQWAGWSHLSLGGGKQ